MSYSIPPGEEAHDEGGREPLDERLQPSLDGGVLALADVQIGDMEEPNGHRRPSL